MIYMVKMMSGQEILIDGEKDLAKLINEINQGMKLIVTKYGIINSASVDSIVPATETTKRIETEIRLGYKEENVKEEVLGVSPFAKMLSDKMSMLSPQQRTFAQEESQLKRLK